MNIPIFHTYIHPEASVKVKDVLQSTFLSQGKLVEDFEQQLSLKISSLPIIKNKATIFISSFNSAD